MKYKGSYTVMVTAFDEEGALNLDEQARFTDWQIRNGIHGLVPLGSTGEFLSLSRDENRQLAECVINASGGRVPVFIGAGAERTEDVVDNCKTAEKLGADGLMIIPPFYSTPTESELFNHYSIISKATDLPIMIYNNPATANVDMTPDTVAKLAEIPNVELIKESTLEVTRVRDIKELCGERMQVFGGILGYESFLEGAVGWISVAANILPKECSDLYVLSAEDKKIDAAMDLYRRILPIIRLVGGHRYVSATKVALAMIGFKMGEPRLPRLPLPEDEM
ncbi:MAG: dihydrodipicolinate synthase family protein, partial [Albidovulum sp.]|nr:dihydrodipicolinate synthase family protein [Albidovulum sp.]